MEKYFASSGDNSFIRPRGSASKNPAVTALQDLLFYQLIGIGFYAKNVLEFEKFDKNTNNQITRLLYLTNKNINFSISTMMKAINLAYNLKNRVENLYKFICKNLNEKPEKPIAPAVLRPGETLSQMVSQANVINAQKNVSISDFNVFALKEIIRLSLCATSNYLEHIKIEDNLDISFYSQIYEILNFLGKERVDLKECVSFALKAGELHTQTLEALTRAYEKSYGFVEKKEVFVGHKKGNAILVVGDDLKFLKQLLEETKDKNINIYTYSTLTYAHIYPEINKYKNLVGIYWGKYDNFAVNIENFEGVVVLTSGNIEELTDIFRGRIFSTEDISMLGITKLDKNNLKPLINAAYDAQGFEFDKTNKFINVGFGIKELENYTEKFYKLIKTEKIKNVFVFLGCSYFLEDKNYLKKIIKMLPATTVFLTLDCFSFVDIDLKVPKIDDVPRILSIGQFANLFILVRFLFSLAGKFRKEVNDVPLNIMINLRGSETIATLLMLLSLGVKNIKINSEMPNYLTDSLIKVFAEKYNLSQVSGAKKEAFNIIFKKA